MSFQRSKWFLIATIVTVCGLSAACPAQVRPSKKSLIYTLANPSGPNAVIAYELNKDTGALTFKGSYPTGGTGQATDNIIAVQQSAITSDGHFLYVVNPGSSDLSVFRIKEDGSLILVRWGIPSGGRGPVSIALRKHLMYVANIGDDVSIPANYTGFHVEGGEIEPISNSTVPLNVLDHPADILFNPDGKFVVASRGIAGTVDVFAVGDDGRLARTGELPGQPGVLGLAFNPVRNSQLVGALTFLPGAASYAISDSGDVKVISTVVDPPSIDSCWEVIARDGSRAWVSAPMSATVTLYHIDDSGVLSRISAHATSSFGAGAADMTFDSKEKFIYLLKSFGNKIHVLRINGSSVDGGVDDVQTIDIPGSSLSAIGLLRVDLEDEDR